MMPIEEYSFVSADGHVVEPAELWLTRMDKKTEPGRRTWNLEMRLITVC